jgi:hypothetical protein
MNLIQEANAKSVSEILHFTRGDNFVGILAQGAVLSRNTLNFRRQGFEMLEFVGIPAWADRSRDVDWWDFINLSIQSVNQTLLDGARRKHTDQRWFILSFSLEVLMQPGIMFTDTNNAYIPYVTRADAAVGFNLPFCQQYRDAQGKQHNRNPELPIQYPTSQQAEILYPNVLDLTYLKKVYVEDEPGAQHANSAKFTQDYLSATFHDFVVEINPNKFKSHPLQEKY